MDEDERQDEILDDSGPIKEAVREQARARAKQAAKDVAKKAAQTAKKSISKMIVKVAIRFLPILLGIILIAGAVFVIVDKAGDIIKEIKDLIPKDFFSVDYDNYGKITVKDEEIDKFIKALEERGISLAGLRLMGDIDYSNPDQVAANQEAARKYLRKFYQTQVVTETINIKPNLLDKMDAKLEDGVFGDIYLYFPKEYKPPISDTWLSVHTEPYSDGSDYTSSTDSGTVSSNPAGSLAANTGSKVVNGATVATYTSSSGKTYSEFKQNVGPWAGCRYGNKTIAAQGCNVTSIAIALSGYGYDFTPANYQGGLKSADMEVKKHLKGTQQRVHAAGSEGRANANLSANHKNAILDHLKTGNAVIIHVLGARKGYSSNYTRNQHWMVLLDVNGNQVYVSNPSSSSKNGWVDIDTACKSLCCYTKVAQ